MRQYDMKAEPGEKTVIELKVTDQTSIRVLVIEGKEPGKTLVVTAGVHGCEYIGMEALRQLGQELEPENMSGRLILIPVVNEAGFYAGARQVNPSDGKNLNREFPGKEDGTITQRIAKVLEQEIYPVAHLFIFHMKQKKVCGIRPVVALHPYPFLTGSVLLPKMVSIAGQPSVGFRHFFWSAVDRECGQNGRLKHIRKMCWN